ncbi:MAG: S24 family peptidase [Sterolibacterium sp.]
MTKTIPLKPVAPTGPDNSACSAAEPFALMVLGDSMLPEFEAGDVVVIEPEGLAREGSFVLVHCNGDWIFRQLDRHNGQWLLHPLNPNYPDQLIADLATVRGVIIQKSKPGRRRDVKRYLE